MALRSDGEIDLGWKVWLLTLERTHKAIMNPAEESLKPLHIANLDQACINAEAYINQHNKALNTTAISRRKMLLKYQRLLKEEKSKANLARIKFFKQAIITNKDLIQGKEPAEAAEIEGDLKRWVSQIRKYEVDEAKIAATAQGQMPTVQPRSRSRADNHSTPTPEGSQNGMTDAQPTGEAITVVIHRPASVENQPGSTGDQPDPQPPGEAITGMEQPEFSFQKITILPPGSSLSDGENGVTTPRNGVHDEKTDSPDPGAFSGDSISGDRDPSPTHLKTGGRDPKPADALPTAASPTHASTASATNGDSSQPGAQKLSPRKREETDTAAVVSRLGVYASTAGDEGKQPAPPSQNASAALLQKSEPEKEPCCCIRYFCCCCISKKKPVPQASVPSQNGQHKAEMR